MAAVYSELARLVRENRAVALATVTAGPAAGAKLLIPADGAASGAIHPDLDAQIAADALELLAAESSETRSYSAGADSFDVFIESFPPPQRLIIVGAVHVAIPLHRLAKVLGYHVTVVDAREWLATAERFPLADAIVAEWPDDALNAMQLDMGCAIVVLTHDPKFDQPALLVALKSEARYIGAIGSRSTNQQRAEALREQGITEEQIRRIFAPIGLDLGAQTPAEIALAILAEVSANRRGRNGGSLRAAKAVLSAAP